MSGYKLQTPVTFNSKTYDSLTFRKMKAKDIAVSDAVDGNAKKGFAILASMAEVPLPVILELDVDDLEGVQEAAAPFMGRLAASALAEAKTDAA